MKGSSQKAVGAAVIQNSSGQVVLVTNHYFMALEEMEKKKEPHSMKPVFLDGDCPTCEELREQIEDLYRCLWATTTRNPNIDSSKPENFLDSEYGSWFIRDPASNDKIFLNSIADQPRFDEKTRAIIDNLMDMRKKGQ